MISKIISQNQNIMEYFVAVWKVCLFIYKGEIVSRNNFVSQELVKQIVGSIIEVYNAVRQDNEQVLRISWNVVKNWYDNCEMFKDKPNDKRRDVAMFTRRM